ncbi:MAG: rRNA methyltransferase [Geminicoccaceae bacterium]|nr:MAG: rRNA methyltransferase [Geminicoccaceae bacterium]
MVDVGALAAHTSVAYLGAMSLAVRGYFGVGAEGISKPGNLGALVRTAHAFGASFLFFVNAYWRVREAISDTSKAERSLPLYEVASAGELVLPRRCKLVGVELTDDAVPLPSFRHPLNAAYVFGPERGSLSPEMTARCDWIVRIPTHFSLNLGIAVAIVLYDRWLCYGRYPERPVHEGAPIADLAPHVHGRPLFRRSDSRAEATELRRTNGEPEP